MLNALAFLWNGPRNAPSWLETEWRLVAIRWLGIAFMLPSIRLLGLPADRVHWAYVVLVAAAAYNLLIQRGLRREPRLFISGYFTTFGDALLNVAMITLGGGFGTPLYYLLYTVTIASAMQYGYGPATAVTLTFVGFDGLERLLTSGTIADGPFLVRSGFLILSGLLASHLRSQARRAEHALQAQFRQAKHEALHDTLTGLPNRTLLNQWLTDALEDASVMSHE